MSQTIAENKQRVPVWLTAVSFIIVAALIYLSLNDVQSRSYSIYERTWGFDHFLFYESITQYFLLFVTLLLLVPYSNGYLSMAIIKLGDVMVRFRSKKMLLFVFFSLLSVFIFYLLNVKYYFLGDFNLRLIQTMKKEWVSTEYATMRLLYLFAKTGEKAGANADQMFRLYSYLAGGVYVFFSFLIADISVTGTTRKIFVFLAQLSTAMLLIFCGYVEIYATPAILLHIYTYSGLCYLRGKHKFVWPVVTLGLSIASHLLCVAALPSLLVLYYFKEQDKFLFIRRQKNLLIGFLVVLAVIGVTAAAILANHPFILPWKHRTYLTFLSKPHLWELFNGQLLSCGLFIVFLILLSWVCIDQKIKWSGTEYFLLAITGGLFFLVFVSNLQRGSGDWDLMSFPALTTNLLTILLIFRVYNGKMATQLYLATMITGLSAIHAFLWLHINHTDRSIAKIKTMLLDDPASYYSARISGAVQLALTYKNNDLYREAEEMALEICNNSDQNDMRACVMYGMRLRDAGRIDEAKVFFEDFLQNRSPYMLEAYLFLLKYYQDTRNPQQVHFYLDKLYHSFKQNPSAFINNLNFKKDVMIEMFNVYYNYEAPAKNEGHLAEIKNMVEALKELKITRQKQ